MKKLIFTFIVLIGLSLNAQENIELPQKSITEFLNLCKIVDIPEAKIKLDKIMFESITIPVVNKYEIIYGDFFNTDVDNISGFKSIILINDGNFETKYLLISYKDSNNIWKIFDFRKSLDVQKEVDSFSNKDIYPIKIQYKYRNYAYWLIMNGQLNKAKEIISKAFEYADSDNDLKFKSNYLNIIEGIVNQK